MRTGTIYQRMPLVHLVRFMNPVRLVDLPTKREGGYSASRWALLVSMEESEGILESPGKEPFWQTTDKGTARCIDYLELMASELLYAGLEVS